MQNIRIGNRPVERPYRMATLIVIFCCSILNANSQQYPLWNMPAKYRSPSGEGGQILIDGIVKKVSFFHGQIDDEADWHVYLTLSPKVLEDFKNYSLHASGLYSEIMVLDRYRKPFIGDDKFWSADVSKTFLLYKADSRNVAWYLGQKGIDDQGDEQNYSSYSSLNGGRVYLQGSFVNDKEHGKRPEIHPLDAIAFAMNHEQKVYASKPGESGWPREAIKWRVTFLMNSKIHRINGESYMKKDRTTTFLLDLPSNAQYATGNIEVLEERQKLKDGARDNSLYSGRGWGSFPKYEIVTDPNDGLKKLKVTAVMKQADNFGGIVVCDYNIKVKVNPIPFADLAIRKGTSDYASVISYPEAQVQQGISALSTAVYFVRAHIQGETPVSFILKSGFLLNSTVWSVKVSYRGEDITSKVNSSTGWKSPVYPGETGTPEIKVEVKNLINSPYECHIVLRAITPGTSEQVDVVKMRTKVGSFPDPIE